MKISLTRTLVAGTGVAPRDVLLGYPVKVTGWASLRVGLKKRRPEALGAAQMRPSDQAVSLLGAGRLRSRRVAERIFCL